MRPWIPLVVGLAACMGSASLEGPSSTRTDAAPAPMEQMEGEMAPAAPAMGGAADGLAIIKGSERKEEARQKSVGAKGRANNEADKPSEPEPQEVDGKDQGGGGDDQARTRAWFPESFLWQPLVETDGDGVATVDVTVPDQLTTWRVLGLAHDRSGHQAGAVHSFDSRLPLYVDPVVPGWLFAGDTLDLPVQVVNTTDEPVAARLRAEASGALVGAGEVALNLGPADSDVVGVRLTATASGTGKVSASLAAAAGGDRAEREVLVLPLGRPVASSRGGTLAGERAFTMSGPEGSDPATEELTVQVYPGPLAVLQAEVERLDSGAVPDDGAYGFALSARLSALSASAGVEVDPRAIRGLQLVAWQRIVRASRSPDAGVSSDLLASMASVSGHELAEALSPRLIRGVVDGQRGDGTWSRSGSATLQHVLVQTAWAARALPPSEEGARLRAAGAIERYAPQVEDPYTAAVILASGVAPESVRDRMRSIVLEGVGEAPDGERTVSVPSNVVNPWGTLPTHQEMLAWTTLALVDQEQLTWRLDLAAALMGRYDARWGFGAGPADVVALDAVARSLPAITQPVAVILTVDGVEAARAQLDPTQPRVPATLLAATRGGAGAVALRAEPPVPGLAFVATLESWVPWTGEESLPGVDVEVALSGLEVGRTGTIALTLSAPSGEALTVEQGLPAGAVVDDEALAASSGRLARAEVSTDRLRVTTQPFQAGEVIELRIPVQPAFSGRFSTPPLTIRSASGAEVNLPPQIWVVGGSAGS